MKIDPSTCVRGNDGKPCSCERRHADGTPYCTECGVRVALVEEEDLTGIKMDPPAPCHGEPMEAIPLITLSVNGEAVEVPSDGTPIIVGSDRDADLRITGDAWLRPRHICVYSDELGLHIEDIDAGSIHFVQGNVVDAYRRGSRILAGSTFIEVR